LRERQEEPRPRAQHLAQRQGRIEQIRFRQMHQDRAAKYAIEGTLKGLAEAWHRACSDPAGEFSMCLRGGSPQSWAWLHTEGDAPQC
jgi:hypothetical protein